MFRRISRLLALAFALALLITSAAAQPRTALFLPLVAAPQRPVTVAIDPSVKPSQATLPGLRGGPPRPVGAFVQEGDAPVEFVANEVRLRPKSDADLQAFLAKYGGTVIHDGGVRRVAGLEDRRRAAPPPVGRYLVRVDLHRVATANLVATMQQAGAGGPHRFSSDEALRLIALVTGERGWQISPNLLLHADASIEHPDGTGGNIDAEGFSWMTEDSDPKAPGDQGLSVGVTHAWEYLQYQNIPPAGGGTWHQPMVAIIDGGFALDTAGVPLDGNQDFLSFGPAPHQYDAIDNDATAGGRNPLSCGGGACPWHGQSAFGVAAARARNSYGSAGVAGTVALPLLIKVDDSSDTIETAIKTAAANGANVISLSLGSACAVVTWICKIPWDDPWADLRSAVNYARSVNAIVVAAAGNDGKAYYDDKYIPCGITGVICVGAIGNNKLARDYSNYGPAVDIWAPTDISTTPNPDTAGNVGIGALPIFGGTSAATPFVAGVVALMHTLNPDLTDDQVLAILRDTANTSPDPKATRGYVDAYRAVLAAKPNQPPTVGFNSPAEGARISWRAGDASFSATAIDPETLGLFRGLVAFSSNRDGQLCVADAGGSTSRGCYSVPQLSLGTHVITARAVDPHGAEASATRTIEVVNSAPTLTIGEPANNAQFYTSQTITFRGSAIDVDELIADTALIWTAGGLGVLGTGREISVKLPAGAHTIQLAALDSFGAVGATTVSIVVRVGEGFPTARILAPADHALVSPSQPISFTGQASDPEEGTLSGAQLRWYSDLDGFLGTGAELSKALSGPAEPCNPEAIQHTITLEATDSNGHKASHQIVLNVGRIC